ncbi:MAG: sodium:proton exchanger [Chloroflexi bacterium RBG_13_52_14]|nr:MAG: sodium:proton exchanger [Chloroflexi bacterium RBG_13_52_14]
MKVAEQELLIVLVGVLITALVGGFIARALRLPVILGYIVGGMVVGPFGFNLITHTAQIETMAQIGVALLLFTLGMQFSLKKLKEVGRVAVIGGCIQILLTMGLGVLIGYALGWQGVKDQIFFGFLIALSSTMIVLKLLLDRGELDTAHGRVMVGILLIQDLAVVPMMALVPAFGQSGLAWAVGKAVLITVIFLGAMFVIGLWVLPWAMRRVAAVRSRELFLLAIICFCLAVAFATYKSGISLALGAFVAGVLISESDYAYQAIAEVVPLRDIFATLFFVSLGMLINLDFLADHIALVVAVVIAIIAGKFIISGFVPRLFGYSPKTMLYTGAGLFQIGEFSFVLAYAAWNAGVISQDVYDLTLSCAVVTILLTPLGMSATSVLYRRLSQGRRFARILASRTDPQFDREFQLANHVVICGFGRVGRNLGKVLERRGFSYLAVDNDPMVIDNLRSRGVPCIYGDASNPEILSRAVLSKAKVLVVTFHEAIGTELAVRNALKINPKLDIVARIHSDDEREALHDLGVNELVRPEFEASLEIMRHTLHRFGLTSTEIQYIITSLREEGLD